MPFNGIKESVDNLKNRLRSVFNPQDPQKKKNALPPKAHFSIWYFLLVFLVISLLQQYFLSGKVETIPYSQFKQHLAEGTVVKLTIGPDNITGTLKGKEKKPGQEFTTIRVIDPDLVKDLDAHKVNYSGHYESKFLSGLLSWILPLGIFFLIWRFAMKRMGPGMGVMSFSKSKAKLFAQTETKITFADVAGIDEAKEELQEVVEFLKTPGSSRSWEGKFRKEYSCSADPERERPFWPGLWPERPKYLSSASAGLSLWRCLSAWGRRAFAIFFHRPPARPPASSSSMNWTPWGRLGE